MTNELTIEPIKTSRTQDEIVHKIREVAGEDFFGVMLNDLLSYLDFEHANEFLKADATRESWCEALRGQTETPRQKMMNYLPFAWEKANNQRGLSAARSLQHFQVWLWLDGDDAIWRTLRECDGYGEDGLRAVGGYLGIGSEQYA